MLIRYKLNRSEWCLIYTLILNSIFGWLYINVISDSIVYYRFLVFFGLTSVFYAILHFRYSLLFQARVALLVSIGCFAGIVKAFNQNGFFSPVETSVQDFDIGAGMFVLTSFSLLGASAGFMFGRRNNKTIAERLQIYIMPRKFWFWLMVWASSVTILTGYLSAKSYGSTVFDGVYGTGGGEGQLLGNLQSIGVICLVMVCIAETRFRVSRFPIFSIMLSFYFLGWSILLRGGRLEVLSGLMAIIVVIPAISGKITRFRSIHYLILLLLAIFMEAWGSLRSTLFAGATETIIEGYTRLAESGIYHAGTISGIATTFSNILHMVKNHVVELQFGSTYIDYIFRSPPEFLYPSRPADLSLIFDKYGYSSIGGFFELTEAYYNFGAFGCLIIPFFISFFFAKIYHKVLRGNWLYLFMLTALLSVFFRGAWYQSFAYYKSLLTGFVLYFLFIIIKSQFDSNTSTSHRHGLRLGYEIK